jgi:hypothetical protein
MSDETLHRAAALVVASPKSATDDRIREMSENLRGFFDRSPSLRSKKREALRRTLEDMAR